MSISSISSLWNPNVYSNSVMSAAQPVSSSILQQSQSSQSTYGTGQINTQQFLSNFSQEFGSDAADAVTNQDGSINFSKVTGYIQAKMQSSQASSASDPSTDVNTAVANAGNTSLPDTSKVKGHHHGGGHHKADATDTSNDPNDPLNLDPVDSTTDASASSVSTPASASAANGNTSILSNMLSSLLNAGTAAAANSNTLLSIIA